MENAVGATPRDKVYYFVYDARARMGHWLDAWHARAERQRQLDSLATLPEAIAAPLRARFQQEPEPVFRPVPDEEAAVMLAQAEAAEAVPAEVAAAYRELIEARPLAEPPAEPTDADAARLREVWAAVRAWLDTQG